MGIDDLNIRSGICDMKTVKESAVKKTPISLLTQPKKINNRHHRFRRQIRTG